MCLLKIIICFGLFVATKTGKDLEDLPPKPTLLKTFHSDYFDAVDNVPEVDASVEGSAVVLKSNLPAAVQQRLALALTAIYQTTSDNLQRAQQFQTTTARMYPVYWNVVINFNVITFYSQYYILLQIDGDRVLAFGLN